ncbi:hypothetical protein MBLNU13_g04101t2 [Cladosporium sp. NU13]
MCSVQSAIAINSTAWEYDNALNEFKFMQLGPTFAKDHAECQIRLACQALRLSRWGVATGVYGGPAKDNGLIYLHGWGDVEDLEEAQGGLEHIIKVFGGCRAEGMAHDEQQEVLTGARHWPGIPGRGRVEWMLDEREDFERLLGAVRMLVTELIEPWERWYRERMQELCWEEAEVLVRENAVPLLVEIASEEDPNLAKALDGVGKKAL